MTTYRRMLAAALLVLAMDGVASPHSAAVGMAAMASPHAASAATIADCPATESALSSDIASAGAGGTVAFDCTAPTTIAFDSALGGAGNPISISQSVMLDGSSSEPVTFDGGHTDTVPGVQLFSVRSGARFDVKGLTMTHGSATGYGGAINSSGTVQITDSTFADDSASSGGGAIYNGSGTLTIENSTLTGNTAGQNGGAVFTYKGTVSVGNSTFAGNIANYGAAIVPSTGSTVNIASSTVADNVSHVVGAIYNNGGTVIISASIVAGNSGKGCAGAAVTDEGYNLTQDVQDCGMSNPTDRTGVSPDLKALTNNGGPTQTMALSGTSPAVDAIPDTDGPCLAIDQRGVHRLDDGESSCDIGAYEHIEHMRIAVSVASGKYSVHIDGTTLEVGSKIDWRAVTPEGERSGSAMVSSSIMHLHAFTSTCPSGHITVDASGRENTPSGVKDVTASYEGDPC